MKSAPTLFAIATILCRSALAAEAINDPALADFADFAQTQLTVWRAPGASLAIVRGEEVIAATGFGFRDLKEMKPMTGETVQPIASISKSFTVASLGVLVRDGKLHWDKPVLDFLPEFRLYDEYATLHVSPRDLVTHATGLPRHDWVWVGSSASREELVRRLRYLPPSALMRTKYQYNNLAFCTAGYLAGRVAGSSWEDLVRTRLFEPLGMKNSSFSVNDLLQNENHATAYRLNEREEATAIRYLNVDSLGPAGAINSNAADMSRYLRMLINKGKFEGQEILTSADVADMSSAKVVVSDTDSYEELGASQYGMGLRISTYRGHKMVQHGGALRGLSASLSFLPEKKIGVFVAVNASESSVPSVLIYRVYDKLLGLEPIDWSKRFRDRDEKEKASRKDAQAQKISTQKTGTVPAHPLADYVGDYDHPGYGIFKVTQKEAALHGAFNATGSKFVHYHYEVFAAPKNEFNSLSEEKIHFLTDIDGEVNSVSIQFEPATAPIVFKRKADAALFDREFLARLVGDYEIGSVKATIALRADNKLIWTASGSVARELEPVRGTRFAMKERAGYSVEFLPDDAGAFNKIAVHNPSGSNLGKRIVK